MSCFGLEKYSEQSNTLKALSVFCERLVKALAKEGAEIYAVGGYVRDYCFGITPGDLDLCTPALPEAVIEILDKSRIKYFDAGLRHGTVTAYYKLPKKRTHTASEDSSGNRGREKSHQKEAVLKIEITTFRRDVQTDGRHAKVIFGTSLESDARRRDFTVNALYMKPNGEIIDPVGGLSDAANRTLRFVGDASQRIQEDHLRILRYLRFAIKYNMHWADEELRCLLDNLSLLRLLSRERIRSEWEKIFTLPSDGREVLPAPLLDAAAASLNTLLQSDKDAFRATNLAHVLQWSPGLRANHLFMKKLMALFFAVWTSDEALHKAFQNIRPGGELIHCHFSNAELDAIRRSAALLSMLSSANLSQAKFLLWLESVVCSPNIMDLLATALPPSNEGTARSRVMVFYNYLKELPGLYSDQMISNYCQCVDWEESLAHLISNYPRAVSGQTIVSWFAQANIPSRNYSPLMQAVKEQYYNQNITNTPEALQWLKSNHETII